MISILKTDITWHPEQINDDKYVLRANRTFVVPGNDFVDYDTGVNLKFPEDSNVIFKLYGGSCLALSGNIMKYSNFDSTRSTVVKVSNFSKDDVTISETQYFLTFELLAKGQSAEEQDAEEPVAESSEEPVFGQTSEETVAEPMVKPVAESSEDVEQNAEPMVKPVAESSEDVEQNAEPVVVEAPKKRKYVKRK